MENELVQAGNAVGTVWRENMMQELKPEVLQEIYSSIIEDADANILLVSEHLKVITLNPGFYRIFLETYGIDLRSGVSIIDSIEGVNPKLAQIWRERCMNAINGIPYKVEDTFQLDGRTFIWEVYYKCIALSGSHVISVFSRDITVRKVYQKRLLENEANLRSIFNTLENSIWLINSRLALIDFNKEFYRRNKQAFGIRMAKGKNIIELIPEHLAHIKETWKKRYEAGLKGKSGKYYDTYFLDGEWRTYEIKTYPISEAGMVCGLTIYSHDITQQKKTEDILKQQNEELTRINSELDRFVYSASHDLRAPLMSVKGLVNVLRLDHNPSSTEKYLALIEQSVNKLDQFISDIIHHSRNSRMDMLFKEINFHELLSESIASLKYMEGAEQVECKRDIQTGSPFYSDPSRLLIIFNNIIANAVRYRDPWKKQSYIHIEITTNAESARMRFSDNGIGIAREYHNNLFKMFFRASAESKGSGLGLYIVKSVIEKLGGTIAVQSDLGIGTSFQIVIPNNKSYGLNLN
ncbi:PAS domain-containing sensor histidine kinase [Oscillatoria amoena NRMC-F 0135]|nr:PAS domain-containing sensor histidine kinase [Oscillatoria amoena NRMC-F 0135]